MFCNTCKYTLLTHFLETAVLQKGLSFTTHLTNLSFAAVGILLIIETLIIIFTYEKVSCLKWVLRKMRYTQSLLLKYAIRRVILYLLARVLGHTHKKHSSNTIVL